MQKAITAAFFAITMLAGPVEAWTVTTKSAAVSSSNANATIVAQTYTAGSIAAFYGISRGATSSDVLKITGSITGEIPVEQVHICAVGGSPNKVFLAWIYAGGGSETWTLNNSAGAVTSLLIGAVQIDGGAVASVEDAAAYNCNTAQGLTPNVTTSGGSLSESGELVLGVTARIGSSLGYTEDPTFTQIGSEGGNSSVRMGAGYRVSPSTSPVTYAPTVTQSNANIAVMAFKPVSGTPATTSRMGPLLGVQN